MTQDPRDLPGGAVDGTPPADPVLRRMLDAAPDRDAAPHPATREAILRTAHNAVAPSALTASQPRDAEGPWWKRLWGGTPGSRMPWNAAFATVLVALFVTVLWHREPVPDARLDAEAPAASPVAPAPTPAPAPAPAAPVPTAPPTVAPPASDSAPAAAPASRPSVATREREPARGTDARATREERRSAAEADATSEQRAVAQPAAKAQAESLAERRELQSSPPAVAPAPAPITVAPGAEANLAPSPSPSPAGAGAPSVASVPRAAPAAPAAAERERAFGDATLAERAPSPARDAPFGTAPPVGAGKAGAPTPPPPLADLGPAPVREAAAPPAALARRALAPAGHPGAWRGWTHLRIVDASGQSHRLARAEAAQLGALVEAAIPSASGAVAAEAPAPGWRIVLEGARGVTLGVLEVPAAPGRTLHWREGTAPPVAAEPPPAVLDALRRALAER